MTIPIDDETSIYVFCHSFGSLWRLLLRLVKKMGFRDTLLGPVGWAGLGMNRMTDGAILLLRLLLLRFGYVEKA